MSKHAKTFQKMRARPVPSDIRWDDMSAALKSLGFKQINGGGSRRKFFHKDKNVLISCHEPHPSPHVDKGCVTDVVDLLVAHGFI